jgi:hypothetical protein
LKEDKKVLLKKLRKEWDSMKNDGFQLDQWSSGSGRKFWWKCNKGHQWEAQIRSRYLGTDCPMCKGRLPSPGNNLSFIHPNLAKEWHPKKNLKLTPNQVMPGSKTKVWWQCKKDHIWNSTIASRVRGSGCPVCAGRKVRTDNNLSITFPQVAKEWHKKKNGDKRPTDFSYASNFTVWWQCKNAHEWNARIASRTSNKTGCPECYGRKVGKINDLSSNYPKLVKQWHPTKNGNLKPKDVAAGSTKKVWWQCAKGHEWLSVIRFRTSRATGCPVCTGHKAGKDNNLSVQFPKIAKEWHPTKNEPLTPKDVTYGSGKKVWWKCSKGHTWETPIVSRSKGNICPICRRQK